MLSRSVNWMPSRAFFIGVTLFFLQQVNVFVVCVCVCVCVFLCVIGRFSRPISERYMVTLSVFVHRTSVVGLNPSNLSMAFCSEGNLRSWERISVHISLQFEQSSSVQIPVFCFNSWEDNCFFSVQLLYGLGLLVLLSTSGEDTGVLFSLAQRSIYCRLLRGCFDGFIYFMDSLSSCSFQPRFITVDSCVPWYALYLERRDEATHVVEVHSHWYFILCTGKLWQTLKSVQEGCRVTADVDTVAACLRSLRANAPWSKGQLRPFHRLKIDWIDTKIYVLIYFFI